MSQLEFNENASEEEVIKVVESCGTREQFNSALNYLQLWVNNKKKNREEFMSHPPSLAFEAFEKKRRALGLHPAEASK